MVFQEACTVAYIELHFKLTEFWTVLGMAYCIATEALLIKLALVNEEGWAGLTVT